MGRYGQISVLHILSLLHIYMINNKGPKMDPCGTPVHTDSSSENNRFLPVGLKSNLWERQGTPYVYGSSGLSCSGGSTRNRIVGVRTHLHRVAYPTQTHHWASGWHPVTKAIQKTHIPWLNAISELTSHHNTCVVDCFRYVRQVCRHYWRVLF